MDKKIKFTPKQLTELQSFFQQNDFTSNMTLDSEYDFDGERAEQHRQNTASRLDNIFTILDGMKNHPLAYDDAVIRQILQCVIVESKEKIKVVFIGGMEVKAKVEQ